MKAKQQNLEGDQEEGWEEDGKRRSEREAQGEEQWKEEEHHKRQAEKARHAQQGQLVKLAMTFFFPFLSLVRLKLWLSTRGVRCST